MFSKLYFHILLSFKEKRYFYAINVCHHQKGGECWIKDSIQGFHCCFDVSKHWVENNIYVFLLYVKNIFIVEKLLSHFNLVYLLVTYSTMYLKRFQTYVFHFVYFI